MNSDREVCTLHFSLLFGHSLSLKANKTVTKTDINSFGSSDEHSLNNFNSMSLHHFISSFKPNGIHFFTRLYKRVQSHFKIASYTFLWVYYGYQLVG